MHYINFDSYGPIFWVQLIWREIETAQAWLLGFVSKS